MTANSISADFHFPPKVRTALVLLLASWVVSILVTPLTTALIGGWDRAVATHCDEPVLTAVIALGLLGLIFAISRGRAWARNLNAGIFVSFVALEAAMLMKGMGAGWSADAVILNVIWLLLEGAGVSLLFTSDARRWFRTRKLARAA